MELEVLHDGSVIDTRTVGDGAIHVGRSPVNELVLRHPGVSGHHAVLWSEGGVLRVRDLGSTNGTFVNETRLTGPETLADGDVVRFGTGPSVRVCGRAPAGPAQGPLRLEAHGTDVAVGITSDRVTLPGDEDAVLLFHPDGVVQLALDGEEAAEVQVDQPFRVGVRTWVLRRDPEPTPATVKPSVTPYDYVLTVDLDGQKATIRDRATGAAVEVTTENRVALLYALGQRWLLDDGEGGWLDDREAQVAVWGREHLQHGPNNYNVLVHRVRSELNAAGLDRWCVEKRSGRTRIRVAAVDLGS